MRIELTNRTRAPLNEDCKVLLEVSLMKSSKRGFLIILRLILVLGVIPNRQCELIPKVPIVSSQ